MKNSKLERFLKIEKLEDRQLMTAAPANYVPVSEVAIFSTETIEPEETVDLGEIAITVQDIPATTPDESTTLTDKTTILSGGDWTVHENLVFKNSISVTADTTLHVADDFAVTIFGDLYHAGIEIAPGSTLTIIGGGSLAAYGGACAPGIGKSADQSVAGNLIIAGCDVKAFGGLHSSGICCSEIEVTNGSLVAYAGADTVTTIDAISAQIVKVADQMVLLGSNTEAATSVISVTEIPGHNFIEIIESESLTVEMTVSSVGDYYSFNLPEGTTSDDHVLRTRSSEGKAWNETKFTDQNGVATASIPKSAFKNQIEYEVYYKTLKVSSGKVKLAKLETPEFTLGWDIFQNRTTINFVNSNVDETLTFIRLENMEAKSIKDLLSAGKIKNSDSGRYSFQATSGSLSVKVSAFCRSSDSIVVGKDDKEVILTTQSAIFYDEIKLNIWSLLRRSMKINSWKNLTWMRLR